VFDQESAEGIDDQSLSLQHPSSQVAVTSSLLSQTDPFFYLSAPEWLDSLQLHARFRDEDFKSYRSLRTTDWSMMAIEPLRPGWR
jgi:hypothetical protein